jgi:hypothetical protein
MSSNIPQQQQRSNPKAQSLQNNSQQWKDNLRRDCIERAKSARRERLRRQRSSGAATDAIADGGGDSNRLKRGFIYPNSEFDTDHEHPIDHNETCNLPNEDSAMQEARALVEQQLHESMIGLRHCQHILPADGVENPSKRKMKGVVATDMNVDVSCAQFGFDEDECKMSEEEYSELVNAVTEELERECV